MKSLSLPEGAKIIPFLKKSLERDKVSLRNMKTTCLSLEDKYYEVINMSGFQLEEHLRATERLFPEECKGWFKQHSTCTGYALRYDDKTWPDIAKWTGIPTIRVGDELYLLIYELGPLTLVRLTSYQGVSTGYVDPTMLDILFADYFQPLVIQLMGLDVLDAFINRVSEFDIDLEPRTYVSPVPNGRPPSGIYQWGPYKGKPFYRYEE